MILGFQELCVVGLIAIENLKERKNVLERNDTKGRKTNQKPVAITEALKKVTWERVFIGDV